MNKRQKKKALKKYVQGRPLTWREEKYVYTHASLADRFYVASRCFFDQFQKVVMKIAEEIPKVFRQMVITIKPIVSAAIKMQEETENGELQEEAETG